MLAALLTLATPAGAAGQRTDPPARLAPGDLEIVPGMRVVLAVNDATSASEKDEGIVQGDYEMVVEISVQIVMLTVRYGM